MPIDKEQKEQILQHLGYGKQHAIKKENLAHLCGMHERALRIALRELVNAGYPICGSPNPPYGYYIANNIDEIQDEMRLLRKYGGELLGRYSALRKAGKRLLKPNQLEMVF